jgi:tight adherence protein C
VVIYAVIFLVATSVALAVIAVAELLPGDERLVSRQLSAVQQLSRGESAVAKRAPTQSSRARLAGVLGRIGKSLQRKETRATTIRDLLVQAGYRRTEAISVFWGTRVALMAGLTLATVILLLLAGQPMRIALFSMLWAGVVGWLMPKVYLRIRAGKRRREIDRNLPDALDLLVVCMEAGLGLNQALARMSEEIRHFSAATSDEFTMVNLEMRAGVPRTDALRSLGTRMGVADLRSLSTMLIQADRFGTSVAQALRVHAETSRDRRRQRSEEAAAKTTIKLIFPIVLCVLPTVFIIVLGPAIIGFVRTMKGL